MVGGGIAGAAACLRLADLGHPPLWIAPPLADDDKPGEHLAAAARPLLARLGALDLLEAPYHRPAQLLVSCWGSDRLQQRSAMQHPEGPPLVLNRPTFERDLAARALGRVRQRIEGPVAAVARCGEGWRIETGGGPVEAGYLIDASGRKAVVAGSRSTRLRADRLAALTCFLARDPANDVAVTRTTLIEAQADGWWYASLLNDMRMALLYFSDGDLLPKQVTRQAQVFPELLAKTRYVGPWLDSAGYRADAPPKLVSAGTTWLAPAVGEGWAAVGDAAAAFDPLSSHGMTTALWSALKGAEGVAAALAGDGEPLARYADSLAHGVQDFLAQQATVYARESRFDGPFWQRRRKMTKP